jgi:hypothetical protein
MSTNAQIAANRQNAQHSTGPTSEAGRQRSALNSVKHGFTGQTMILPAAEAEAYKHFTEAFLVELAPKGVNEEHLAHMIMTNRWRLTQIAAMEAGIYALGHREYIGEFAGETPEMAATMARLKTFEEKRKELDRLRRYESALNRQVNKDLANLTTLQTERKVGEAQREKDAIALLTHFTTQGKPWNPADFGFDLSIEQIQAIEERQFLRNSLCKP